MFNTILSWAGGGLAFILLYLVVSNTLWLLFGSRLLQCLPGVNIKGTSGTLKIAVMIILSTLGSLVWILKYSYLSLTMNKVKPVFKSEVSKMIQHGARIIESRRYIKLSNYDRT